MAKQLSMSKVKQDNKKYNETVELDVTVQNEEYTVKIYPFFAPTKIAKMLQDLVDFYQKAKQEEVEIDNEDMDGLIGYFIVKHFTNIKFTGSKKAKTIYAEYKEAIDSQLFDVILKSIPEESIKNVYEKLFDFQELNAKFQKQLEKFKDVFDQLPLENREIIENAFKNKKRKQIPEV